MIIYHGTDYDRFKLIMTEGIKPRKEEIGTKWLKMPSNEDMVYLSVYNPFYYATQGLNGRKEKKGVVLEVEIDNSEAGKLYPDEDYLRQSGILSDNASTTGIEDHKEKWEDSLKKLGNVCYKGKIDIKKIRRYCIIDFSKREELLRSMLTMESSLSHHSLLKDKGETLIKWLFDETDELHELKTEREIQSMLDIHNSAGLKKWEEESVNREGIEVVTLH